MFTGLIEAVGNVLEMKPTTLGFRLRVETLLSRELSPGDNIAVNGVCLTVTTASADDIRADISPETARVSTLGSLKRSSLVNLERPMRADGRVGGHFVQGHVDATGVIEDIRQESETMWLTVEYPSVLAVYLVRNGSIAVDGISLTVAGLGDTQFDVQITPYIWEHTNLHAARARDPVNLECDLVGKYVVRMAEVAGLNAPPHLPWTTH